MFRGLLQAVFLECAAMPLLLLVGTTRVEVDGLALVVMAVGVASLPFHLINWIASCN